MPKIYNSILDTIGNTPIVKLNKIVPANAAEVYVKLEFFNPTGSIKDRIAQSMIAAGEQQGNLKPGDTIVEPTSGNTGIGIAAVGAVKGYKVVIVMPTSMSIERRKLMKGYGAKLVLTPASEGVKGTVAKARELSKLPHYFMPMQFENPANPEVHEKKTGQEIINAFGKENLPNAFVAGAGTGGTLTGIGRALKNVDPQIKVYALEPAESPLLKTGHGGSHKIQGISAGFIPKTLDTHIYDGIVEVPSDMAIKMGQKIGRNEGFMPGISSGANIYGAIQLAKKLGQGKKVITVAPDSGDRYLSTDLYKNL